LPGELPAAWKTAIDRTEIPEQAAVFALRVVHPLPAGKPLRFANQAQDRHAPAWLSLAPKP
jgi:hypothetical protein